MNNIHSQHPLMILRDASLVSADGVTEPAQLLIEEGRIAGVFAATEEVDMPDAEILDLSGSIIFPGFVDVHIHGAVGVDTMEATADGLHRIGQFLASKGVTAWLPTLVPAPDKDYRVVAEAVQQLVVDQEKRQPAARVVGLHYEGPFVNETQCGALRTEYFKTFSSASDLEQLPLPRVRNAVRMMTMAPEIEGGVELIRELVERDWVVSLGHTRATVEVLDRALAAGARHMTHFMNAMPSLHHRAPGPVGWGLTHDDVTCDMIADGIHLDPQMLKLLAKIKKPERLTLISDAIAAAGMGDGDYLIWDQVIKVVNGRTSNSRGSIAGSVSTMIDAVRMMLSLGVAEAEVGTMAATNPARLLGIDEDYGSIEEGKRADLVALDQNGRVKLTLVGGRVAFDARS